MLNRPPRISGNSNGGTKESCKAIWGVVFPYISRIHTAYIGEGFSLCRWKSLGRYQVWIQSPKSLAFHGLAFDHQSPPKLNHHQNGAPARNKGLTAGIIEGQSMVVNISGRGPSFFMGVSWQRFGLWIDVKWYYQSWALQIFFHHVDIHH